MSIDSLENTHLSGRLFIQTLFNIHLPSILKIQFECCDNRLSQESQASILRCWHETTANHVESRAMMAPTPPYDRTTPPSCPRTNNHMQIPRPGASAQGEQFNADPPYTSDPRNVHPFDPRDGRPAVWPWPRLTKPDSQRTSSRDTYLSSRMTPPCAARFQNITMFASAQSDSHHQPLRSRMEQEHIHQRNMIPAYLARKQIYMRNKSLATKAEQPSVPPPTASSQQTQDVMAAAKARAKEIMSKYRAKCSPSELFDRNFSFASRRRSRVQTPSVSPRTSMSSGSWPPPHMSLDEALNRRSVDSTASAVSRRMLSNTLSTASSQSQDPGSPACLSSRNTSYSATGEAHPGQPVDFASLDARFRGEADRELDLGLDLDLDLEFDSSRCEAKSPSPSATAAAAVTDADTNDAAAAAAGTTQSYNDHLMRDTHGSLSPPPSVPRKRAHSFPYSHPHPATSPKRPSPSPLPSASPRRSPSDPCAEAFLAHVRASLEARRRGGGGGAVYAVFSDEEEKGFWDAGPL
ncbi:hypothetical protein ACN47E_001360 [Coniothyrium glycines]